MEYINKQELFDALIKTEYDVGDYHKIGWSYEKIIDVVNHLPIYSCPPKGYDAYLWWDEDLQKWTVEPEDLDKLLGRKQNV